MAIWQLACASQASTAPPTAVVAPAPSESWQSTLDRKHVLVGKIWDVQARAFVEQSALLAQLARSRFVLLGERHDNPDHHRLQARLLQGMVARGRRPSVVLEMLELEQQPAVDEYLARPDASASGFGSALRWQDTSWPPFVEYQPIFEVALAAKLPIACGNLAHAAARGLVKQGLAALPAERVQQLRLDRPFPEALGAPLADELRASHCGHLPESLIEPMALAQHARDSQMASVMLSRGAADGAVLIAGAGHARRDRGVPYYLALAQPQASVVSLALQEVAHDVVEPSGYAPEASAFDYVWFTPRGSDEDPCAAFHEPRK
jgi:uncharacterized iron-regulated protein